MARTVVDTLVAMRLLRLFSTPYEKHPAYEKGIIDNKGNKIKDPQTAEERDAYTFLDRLGFRIRRALTTSSNASARRLLVFASAIAMLREHNDVEEMSDEEFQVLIDMYSQDENVINEARILEAGNVPFKYFMMGEEVANVAGPMTGGKIAGLGTDAQGEPGRKSIAMPLQRRKKKRKFPNVN